MSYSTITHALVSYVEGHLANMSVSEMAKTLVFQRSICGSYFTSM